MMKNLSQIKIEVLCAAESPSPQKADAQRFRRAGIAGVLCIAYNLRRMMNILDKNIFKKFLKELGFLFFAKLFIANENAIVWARPIFEVSKSNLFLRAA